MIGLANVSLLPGPVAALDQRGAGKRVDVVDVTVPFCVLVKLVGPLLESAIVPPLMGRPCSRCESQEVGFTVRCSG